ncbi:HAD hydrolase-like protein [Chroococcidiopsis sp. CCMEE 29]|uniref:HAD hydrolase-like protein n=1 Tax=Chroococcidiopsis sp. CCMEE 29 TaxID=155894 RepID=UPI002021AA5F|nr:HAD hydrolase-like protein [Chroococcidiopsis sp. CCMEE 29]
MTIKVIIFDFDGTIADTLNAIVSITNRLAAQFGHKPISQEELVQIKNLSSRQIIKQSGISIFKFPLLVGKVKAELNSEIQTIKPFLGIKEALIEVKSEVDRVGMLSSNSKENIVAFLEMNGLQDLFDFIYTGATLFGKSKVIKELLKQEKFKPEESVYVGDETRDIEAARRSRTKAIAVSWGFNSKEVLAAQNPDFLVHQPSELVEVIKSLQQAVISK